jgi:alpha-N-arabinofuranosidase
LVPAAALNTGEVLFAQLISPFPGPNFPAAWPRTAVIAGCTASVAPSSFAPLTLCESPRDIEACLGARPTKLYHLGFCASARCSTLAEANESCDWTGSFLKDCWGNFDIIAEHWYAQGGHHWNIEKAKTLGDKPSDDAYVKIDQSLLEFARYPADTVRLKVEEWQGYQQRFPAMVSKKIPLSIDEYAYFNFNAGGPFGGESLKQSLAYAMILNEMARYTDFLTMGAQTTGVSLIDFNRTASTINGLGLVYKMYGDHFAGAIPVALSGNSPQPAPKYPAGGPDQPAKSSGSPTYPLDMYAALSPDRKFLIVSVVNATESEQKIDLNVAGAHLSGASTLWQLTAKSVDALNRVGEAPQLAIKESSVGEVPSTIAVAPISVNIFQFPVAAAGQ